MTGILPSGHTYVETSEEENKKIRKMYPFLADGGLWIQPGNLFYSNLLLKFADLVFNFQVKSRDIYVNTYPKSGTNWISEIIWNLIYNPDLDNPDANTSLDTRFPFFDIDFIFAVSTAPKPNPEGELVKRFNKLCPGEDYNKGLHILSSAALPDPRLLKGHLPLPFWPPNILEKAKVVYVVRDPRDVVVSSYHFFRFIKTANFSGTLEQFVDDFMDGLITSSYWEHVRLAWEKRNHPNFLFLFYEDLKESPKEQIRRVDEFIGTNRSDKQIDNVVTCTSFNYMKEKAKDNPPVSFDDILYDEDKVDKGANFFRKGKAGSWKEELPPHLQEKVNNWMRENLTQFTDDFKYKAEQYS